MPELTQEQIKATESMSLEDIKALALKEAETAANTTTDKPRDEQGKFVKAADQTDNPPDDEEEEEVADDAKTIYRREIDLGDGSGIQVFEADNLEELVDKLADAQRNATKKIRQLTAERKQSQQKTEQQIKDEDYVIEQKFKTNPVEAMKEVVKKVAAEKEEQSAEKQAADQRSVAVGSRFVQTHTDYIADPANGNGNRLFAEFQRLYPQAQELTTEGLEKAYQSLKQSGLLKLRDAEASDATEVEAEDTQRIAETKVEATQQRSLTKKSSNISTRTSTRSAPAVKQGPTLDDLYDSSKYTTAQVRELAEKAMREQATKRQ